jgi:predicted TIM-barrel fold metal-dependent hydrolase
MLFVNHCHVFPESVRADGTLDKLKNIMKECKIDKAVSFAPFSEWVSAKIGDPNDWLAKELPSYPEIIGFACINPLSENSIEQLEKAWRQNLLGVKLHPPIQKFRLNDKSVFRFYNKAQELGMILDFHLGVHGWRLLEYHPLLLDDVAYNFPRLKIIVEHVGGRNFYNEAVALMLNNENVYAGISSVLNEEIHKAWYIGEDKVEELCRLIGEDRLIYGTDFPYNDSEYIKKDIKKILELNLTATAKEKILGENLARILKE